jgi:hypothetical protein
VFEFAGGTGIVHILVKVTLGGAQKGLRVDEKMKNSRVFGGIENEQRKNKAADEIPLD